MPVMDEHTGRLLRGRQAIAQSMSRAIRTPRGTRCMNRDWGSEILDLVDGPATEVTLMQLRAAVVDAVLRLEQRVAPERVALEGGPDDLAAGQLIIRIEGKVVSAEGGAEAGEAIEAHVPFNRGQAI